MASLPVPGEGGNWGAKLNAWLRVAHNDDGTLRQAAAAAQFMALRATTGVDGYRLAAGTGTIIGWMTPDDGALHRVMAWGTADAAAAVAGGAVTVAFTTPAGTARRVVLLAPGQQAGDCVAAVKAGTMVSLVQSSPLTAGGPAVLYAEIWGM